jgi:hypothetical protein
MKHKKLLAILLSLAIMVTFMPMMAFAASTSTVSAKLVKTWTSTDTYAKVTDTDNHSFNTSRVLSDGFIVATAKDDDSLADKTYLAPEWAAYDGAAKAYYYDLENSAFVYGSKVLNGTTWTSYDNFKKALADVDVQVVEPNYTDAMVKTPSKTPDKKVIDVTMGAVGTDGTFTMTGINNRNIVLEISKYDTTKTSEDQTVTLSVKESKAADAVNVRYLNTADVLGTVASATVTIKGTKATWDTAKYYWDAVGGTDFNKGLYSGAAHTIVADPVEGYTVSWQVYNATSGKWDKVDAVSLTDAGTVTFRAVWTKTSTGVAENAIEKTAKIDNVESYVRNVNITWDQDQNEVDDKTAPQYTVPGTEYDAMKYVVVKAVEKEMVDGETTAQTTDRLARNAAVVAAVAANADELKAYLNDYYTVKDITTKADTKAGRVKFQIKKKDLTADEKTALAKKYKKLTDNFGAALSATGNIDTYSKATIVLNGDASKDLEVSFTKAISSKTYKGSKTTKKGKLKKNQTIQFTASAANGKAVKYKLINVDTSKIKIDSTTGKVTLKKGLAKGTYKFIVKAYVPEVSLAYETQNVTIKVKK